VFIVDRALGERTDPAVIESRWSAYLEYLNSVKEHLGPGAAEYAFSEWHSDYAHKMSPHDAWVESISFRENATGPRLQNRSLSGSISLLASYHDGRILFHYDDVSSYQLEAKKVLRSPPRGHGDWLADEVRLTEGSQQMVHEIVFSSGAAWTIVSKDFHYSWVALC
jgi:hypothetical protein